MFAYYLSFGLFYRYWKKINVKRQSCFINKKTEIENLFLII